MSKSCVRLYGLRDISTGKWLTGKRLSADSLADMGASIAIYRSSAAASKSARGTVETYKMLVDRWRCTTETNQWVDRNYLRAFSGVEVVELSITEVCVVDRVIGSN